MSTLISPVAVFVAGGVSFLSPCVLPLVPGFVSVVSADNGTSSRPQAEAKLLHTGLFVAGFSLVFIVLGATAGALGRLAGHHISVLETVAGAIVMVFGLQMAGLLRLPALNADLRLHGLMRVGGRGRSFLTGFAFAFGWTPCVGPVLAGVLSLAASEATWPQGALMLAFYSAGLAVPFLLTTLSLERFGRFYRRAGPMLRTLNIASGVLLVVTGALLATHQISRLSSSMNDWPVFQYLSGRFL